MTRGGQDERHRGGGVLGVFAHAGGDLADARAAQEADGGSEEGHHGRLLPHGLVSRKLQPAATWG